MFREMAVMKCIDNVKRMVEETIDPSESSKYMAIFDNYMRKLSA